MTTELRTLLDGVFSSGIDVLCSCEVMTLPLPTCIFHILTPSHFLVERIQLFNNSATAEQ